MRKLCTLVSLLILCSAIVAIPEIETVKAQGTIYIRADGSVEGTDKIQQIGNVYTFTGNISAGIQVERSNIIVDGAWYTLRGGGRRNSWPHRYSWNGIRNCWMQKCYDKEFEHQGIH